MIGLGFDCAFNARQQSVFGPPAGLGWDDSILTLDARISSGGFRVDTDPRQLVDSAIWTGAALHVDAVNGDDENSGFGSTDGDFSNAKRSIHAAFSAGNATGAAYRVLIRSGEYEGSAFSKNGHIEPAFPVAVIGWNGPVSYRTGPFEAAWTDAGGTYSAGVTSLNRVFRTDVLTDNGLYTELEHVNDLAICQASVNTWFKDGSVLHVNIGRAPGPRDIAAIRNFNGARFLDHSGDLYLENIHIEGGISGALHCDAAADRNVVGVSCSFRYSSPSNTAAPLDAVRIRRTNGLVAFFDCDASGGAKDGWSFHEDDAITMQVVLSNCTSFENGAFSATSCNAVTAHDNVIAAVIGGRFGYSRNGAEVHVVQNARMWVIGAHVTARDPDGSCVTFKSSNATSLWLERTRADAAGGAVENLDIEANGGTVFIRGHIAVAGVNAVYGGGSISAF
jgi:hypothetical protein